MHIKSATEMTGFETAHGEIVREVLGHTAGGASEHSVAHITLPPGKASLKHCHPAIEESYYILSGQGRIMIDNEERLLKAGDAVAIPTSAVHQIVNESHETLIFLAVCTPPWSPDCSIFID